MLNVANNIFMLSFVMLSVIGLSVIMLSVVAPNGLAAFFPDTLPLGALKLLSHTGRQ
jgi:hypothetical protein